jgi:hypothetical protein
VADAFTFVRVAYHVPGTSFPGEIGGFTVGDWATDYPDPDINFARQVEERLGLRADDGVILQLSDPTLSEFPFIYLGGGGELRLTAEEASALRAYLLNGGFLMVDDFWREEEWVFLMPEMVRVFPDRPVVELPGDHDIFRTFYPITERPSVPGAAELSFPVDEQPHYRGIFDGDGRLMVILLHNLDFGDGWEHISDPNYPVEISLGGAVTMGINILVYALMY